ncbi:MAG TPA: MaoC/PaaZ C-terminal domain-containing protein [Chloroflexota bacterium]|nr:MaoC/PaaZ C-terminal domain-containing protein [Chloroflexota bacterium]
MILRNLKAGDSLPPLVKEPISKVQLLKYAGASGDYNLIHTDVETARAAGLGDVIAHGMLSMGFLGQFLTDLAGPENVRRLQVRFGAMVRLGDVLTCRGMVQSVEPIDAERSLVTLDIWAENQRGEKVTTGAAEVFLEGGGRGTI